jgi:type I restriction enzyme S subunit
VITEQLGQLAANDRDAMVDGPFGSNLKASEYVDDGVPIIRLQNIRRGAFLEKEIRFITPAKSRELARHSYQAGDVVIAKLGECGAACIVPPSAGVGIIVADVVRFRGDPTRIEPRYLVHYLNSMMAQTRIGQRTKGTTRARVNLSDLKQILVPVPNITEQRRVADILDKADAIHRKRKEAIVLTEELLRSAFLEMFGDPVTNPKGWPVKPLGQLLGFLTSGSRGWAEYYADAGEIFLRIQNIKQDKLDLSDVAYVRAPDSAEARRTRTCPGDVLLSITADLGRIAVVPDTLARAFINQHLAILRPREVNSEYLGSFLASAGGQRQIKRLNKGGVKAGLNFDDIRSIDVLLPPDKLQRAFAEAKTKIRRLEARFVKMRQEGDELFQSLVARAFSGNRSIGDDPC